MKGKICFDNRTWITIICQLKLGFC